MTVKKCEPKFAVASRRAGPKYRKPLEALFEEKYQEVPKYWNIYICWTLSRSLCCIETS